MSELDEAFAQAVQAAVASVTRVREGEWADRQWLRLVVNYETLSHAAEPETSTISFSVAQAPGGPLEVIDFRLSSAAKTCLESILAIMHRQRGDYWTVCDLIIEKDGRHTFDFGYEAPYRLDGNLHDTRFDDYLQRYVSETT